MNEPPSTVAGARIDAERARARLTATLAELHDRLRPDRLVRRGVDRLLVRGGEIADDALSVARARPALIGGVGAGLLLLWLRRPIARLGRKLFFRKGETDRPAGRLSGMDEMSRRTRSRRRFEETVR